MEVMVSNPEEKDQGLLYVVIAAAIGLVVLGAVYLRFRTANSVGTLADHANVGNAMAPAVAFLTLLAVVAALWSVQIQRTELALQRKELQETRDEMIEQRKQFERTAHAQEALAESQKRLADEQAIANAISNETVRAQRWLTSVTLQAEIARGQLTIANNPSVFNDAYGHHKSAGVQAVATLEHMLARMLKEKNA
jgi:multidrug efflux pump subunit AcrA (membrane-fusion protein)